MFNHLKYTSPGTRDQVGPVSSFMGDSPNVDVGTENVATACKIIIYQNTISETHSNFPFATCMEEKRNIGHMKPDLFKKVLF
jgi:hypothetical protein